MEIIFSFGPNSRFVILSGRTWAVFLTDLVTVQLPGGQACPRQWTRSQWRFQVEVLGFSFYFFYFFIFTIVQ